MEGDFEDLNAADLYLDPDDTGLRGSPLMRPVRVDLRPNLSPPSPKDVRYDQFHDEADPNGWPFNLQLDIEAEEAALNEAFEGFYEDSGPKLKEEDEEATQEVELDLATLASDALRRTASTVAGDSAFSQSPPGFGHINLPSISDQLKDINPLTEAEALAFSQSPPPRPPPRFSDVPDHGPPYRSPSDAFRRELPSPGRGHFYFNANSHRRLSQTNGPQYSSADDYTSSDTETPSTDQSGSTPPTMAIDQISIDGITNPRIGGFPCTYPGCTAMAFQTQYLLNSHANVHSSNRPHYCSVKGCPRSEGGKGFKKKNELIRHGLVHDSPGYVCPFCPDREHKYPRPDNLQRHVRVHHVDKDRDDPQLREVLCQRPEGPSRGRRRRGGTSENPEERMQETFDRPSENKTSDIEIERLPNRPSPEDQSQMPSISGAEDLDPSLKIADPPLETDSPPAPPPGTRVSSPVGNSRFDTPPLQFGTPPMGSPLLEPPSAEVSGKANRGLVEEGVSPFSSHTSQFEEEDEDSQSAEDAGTKTLYATGPPATDSGYASTARGEDTSKDEEQDDARTVCTDNQDLNVPDDLKEKLISAFSGDLMRRLQGLLSSANDTSLAWNTLADLLKEFSLRLGISACAGEQKKAVVFIRHYRNHIATLIAGLIRTSSEPHGDRLEDEEEEPIVPKQDGISAAEKVNLWNPEKPDVYREYHDIIQSQFETAVVLDEEENEDDYVITHFPVAWMFLTSSHAYQWLMSRIRTEMLLTNIEDTQADIIKQKILKGLTSVTKGVGYVQAVSKARFDISWDLPGFLTEKYPDEHELQLGSLVTITRTGDDVQALTCAEYMKQVWPVTGLETLLALQGALDKGVGQTYKAIMTDKTRITLEVGDSIVIATVKGTEPAIAEIGQQLAWMGAALRSSPSDCNMAHSTPLITFSPGKVASFKLTFQVAEMQPEAKPRNGSCWLSLFRNPIIVEGYPILARINGETGLEIPLNMMAGLSQASRVTNFNGGLVIKGFSTMCCPTQRIKDSILWHYLFNDDGSRISFCSGRVPIPEVDAVFLEQSRNFLGWASSVEIHIGTKDSKYEDIDWAGSKFASPGVALDNFHITAGKIITGGASFIRGSQDIPIHLSHAGRPYELEIHHASRMKVVIYDVKDRRGWLVDGTSALLHLSRTQLSSSPYSESRIFNLEDFHYADSNAGPSAAKRALLDPKNRELVLFEDSKTTTELKISIEGASEQQMRKVTRRWTYEDLVQQTYHILEQIEDRQLQMMASSAVGLSFTAREKLLGFGFMDIVDGQNILLPRVATLKKSGWGWVDFTRSIKAIALLGKGFGDMIQPADNSNKLCKYWNHVPMGKDYLVSCISTLEEICRQHGDSDPDVLQLANSAYWHKPDKLFESCECKHGSRKAGCDRVQVLLPHSTRSKKPRQPFDCRSGAAIFGRSRRLPWCWPSRGEPFEGEESESEAEEGSEFHDSALGGNSSTSGLDDSTNLDLSPSDGSLDNRLTSVDMLGSQEIHDANATMQIPDGSKAGNDDTFLAGSETTRKLQMISRGVKRTLDKVTPHAFSRKKQNPGSVVDDAGHDACCETQTRHPTSPS